MSVFTGANGKMLVGPLSDNKEVLRRQVALIMLRFGLEGRKVTKCAPAFATGCEMRSSTRMAIRAERG